MLDRRWSRSSDARKTCIGCRVEACQSIAYERTASVPMLPAPLTDLTFAKTFENAQLDSRRCTALCGFDRRHKQRLGVRSADSLAVAALRAQLCIIQLRKV